MLVSREKMLEYLREAEKIELNRIRFGESAPLPAFCPNCHPVPRIILPLSGTKRRLP